MRNFILGYFLIVATSCAALEQPGADLNNETADSSRLSSVFNGLPTNEFPSVGRLNDDCTATLIGKKTVLTAAHCIKELAKPAGKLVFADQTFNAKKIIMHPKYKFDWSSEEALASYDIALLLLDDAPPVAPMPIARFVPWIGAPLTMVGFGWHGDDDHTYGEKRVGFNFVQSISALSYRYEFLAGDDKAPLLSLICSGDSGGPTFTTLNGVNVLIGVHAVGGATCDSYARDSRVDAFLSWIIQESGGDVEIFDLPVGATSPGRPETFPSTPQSGCLSHADCAGGLCLAFKNGSSMCTTLCDAQYSCPEDYLCQKTPVKKLGYCAPRDFSPFITK